MEELIIDFHRNVNVKPPLVIDDVSVDVAKESTKAQLLMTSYVDLQIFMKVVEKLTNVYRPKCYVSQACRYYS